MFEHRHVLWLSRRTWARSNIKVPDLGMMPGCYPILSNAMINCQLNYLIKPRAYFRKIFHTLLSSKHHVHHLHKCFLRGEVNIPNSSKNHYHRPSASVCIFNVCPVISTWIPGRVSYKVSYEKRLLVHKTTAFCQSETFFYVWWIWFWLCKIYIIFMAGISSKKKGSKLIKDHREDGLKKKRRKERWPVRSKY